MSPLSLGLCLAGAAFLIYLAWTLLYFVPIIERNAFEVPRHRIPDLFELPTNGIEVQHLNIPYSGSDPMPVQYMPALGASQGVVVFCHETGADLNSWKKHAYFLPKRGFDVVSFDFDPTEVTYQWPAREELRSLVSVLNWLERHRPGAPVALFGISKGAVLASALWEASVVHSMILEGAFSTYQTMEAYMKKWVRIYISNEAIAHRIPDLIYRVLSRLTLRYASFRKKLCFFTIEDCLGRLRKPVFLIHAGADEFIPTRQALGIKEALPLESELWIVEGAEHSDTVKTHTAQYQERIVEFLSRTLRRTR